MRKFVGIGLCWGAVWMMGAVDVWSKEAPAVAPLTSAQPFKQKVQQALATDAFMTPAYKAYLKKTWNIDGSKALAAKMRAVVLNYLPTEGEETGEYFSEILWEGTMSRVMRLLVKESKIEPNGKERFDRIPQFVEMTFKAFGPSYKPIVGAAYTNAAYLKIPSEFFGDQKGLFETLLGGFYPESATK